MHRAILGSLVLSLAACQTYQARPLEPQEILKSVEAARRAAGPVVSMAQALELMRKHNPAVREARARFATARAVADVDTPLQNPMLSAGPLLLNGADITGSARYGVESALGWALSLSGRRKLTDELNRFLAESALVDAVATQREEVLALRREYVAYALASRRTAALEMSAAVVRASVETTRRLVEAAQATTLDLLEAELEAGHARLAQLGSEESWHEARAAVAARMGVGADWISAAAAPPLPDEAPSLEALHKLMLRDHPALARKRAAYEVAEKRLEREIARQYPDLEIGGGFEREEGVNRYSLGFGIELPIFDRNQQGIAEAFAARDEVRAGFEAEVTRALGRIDAARKRLVLRLRRLRVVREELGPLAQKALRQAQRATTAGGVDTLRLLSTLRSVRRMELELVNAESAAYEAWSDLEAACGAPLLRFGEKS